MPKRIEFSEEQTGEIVRLYESGLSMKKIGPRFGCGHNPVNRVLVESKVKMRSVHDRKKLSPDQETQLGHDYEAGASAEKLARKYGLGGTTVYRILDRIGVPTRKQIRYSLDEKAFDVIDEATAYWWGFLYADGATQGAEVVVCLSAKDAGHLKKFAAFLKTERPLYYATRKDTGWDYGESHRAILRFRSSYTADRVRELGVVKGRALFRAVVCNLPSKFRNAWIRGYMDGDGSVGRNRARVRFTGSKRELLWIKEVFIAEANASTRVTLEKTKSKLVKVLGYSGHNQTYRILKFLYQDATVWLDRKRELAEKWLKPPSPRRRDERGRFV